MGTDKGLEFLLQNRHKYKKDHYLISNKILSVEILGLKYLKVVNLGVSILKPLLPLKSFNLNVLSTNAVYIAVRDLQLLVFILKLLLGQASFNKE